MVLGILRDQRQAYTGTSIRACSDCLILEVGPEWVRLKVVVRPRNRNMKNQINTLFVVIAFSLAANCASHAMSSLVSLSQQPLWPVTSNPDGNLIYEVTAVGRSGAGLLEVTLTAGNMPPGVTVTFSPSVLRFTGIKLVAQTARMTVS